MNKLKNVERYYNEAGEVGVLVSIGYGAGWSSGGWNSSYQEFLCMDKTLVELCLNNSSKEEVQDYINSVLQENNIEDLNMYYGGWYDNVVEFIPKGTAFYIDEYDGHESLITTPQEMFVA